jgi:hypothetical protein
MSAPTVTVQLPECGLEVLERPMGRRCVHCLDAVLEFPWGFECGCGCAFTLGVVGTAYSGGEVFLVVEPMLPGEEL